MAGVVARHRQDLRDAAGARHLRGQGVNVGVANLEFLGDLLHFDNFVARGDDGGHRPPVDLYTTAAEGGEHGGVAVVQAFACAQNDFASRRLAAPRVDELSRFGGKADADAAVLADGVLNHHHGIGARGNGRAGHDFNRLAGTDCAREALAGAHLANDLQLAGQVDGAHGITVANRAGRGRDVAVGCDVFGQQASGGGFQARLFDGWDRARCAYVGEDGLASLVERQSGHSFYYDRLPLVGQVVLACQRLRQEPARYTVLVPYRSSLCLMASMLREGAISPVELVEAHLRQIERLNPSLNAFVTVLAESALEEARTRKQARLGGRPMGLLDGVPVTIKDSFDVAGLPTLAGSRLRSGNRAAEDSTVVARLRREGAILLGKTNTPELLASYETDNLLTGRTNNPWDVERTPGGSSGGEAAAIAAFCSAGGVGSDGGGSIRVPAHFCGIAGLKPTPGRVPGTGHFPSMGYPGGLVGVAGPMARTAEDLRLLFAALAGYDGQDPFSAPVPLRPAQLQGVRIGVWEQFYRVPADPEIRAAVRSAAAMLEALGIAVEDFEPQGLERAPNIWAIFARWPSAATKALLKARKIEAHWTLREWLDSDPPTAEQVLINLASRDRMRASLLRQMESVAAVLMPVCGVTAFRHRQRKWEFEGQEIGLFQAMMPAVLANVLGLPAVTIPVAISREGLPIGVQLMGRPYEDELLLELAVRLEEARGPWVGVPPPRGAAE